MDDKELERRLRRLRRTVLMLETELRHGYLDEELLADVDLQLEEGIAMEPRCAMLVALVDTLRENTLATGPGEMRDAIRACEKLKDAIEEVVSRIR